MTGILRALTLFIVLGTGTASASPVELRGVVDTERPRGCSDYSFLLWDFYRAELWSDAQQLPGDEFALALTYRSAFTRDELVQASIDEMTRISGRSESSLADARREMEQGFRDVAVGDRITALRTSANELRFYLNGAETGTMTRDVDLFLAIWLGPKSRHKDGREALLAGRCNG
ncbi:MAG TPA: chalcone isomerase family protein [Thermohalobaculum sp.]|nr:chalcone isomerase family protein [Thermohalobaculum sp.]